jgi:hypothetical protein
MQSRAKFIPKNMEHKAIPPTRDNLAATFIVYQVSNYKHPRSTGTKLRCNDSYNGFCIDTGAERTVIGLRQAIDYCRMMKKQFKAYPNG